MNMPESVEGDEFRHTPDFRFSLRFDSRPLEFVPGELEAVCPLCGGAVALCYWGGLELFFEPDDSDPQVVCNVCGRAYAPHLLGVRDAYRRISDPFDSFAEKAKVAYIREWGYLDAAAADRAEDLREAASGDEY